MISFSALILYYILFNPSYLNLLLIIAINFLLATCNIFEDVSFNASMPAVVGENRLTRVNSINSSISSISSIAGPFVGGIIFSFVNLKFFILANALSFFAAALCELFIDFNLFPEEVLKVRKNTFSFKTFFSEIKEGFSFIKSQRVIFAIFSAAIFINFFFSFGINVPFPYIVNNVIGLLPAQFGILESFFPLGILVGSFILAILPERKDLNKTLCFSLLIISAHIFINGFSVLPFLLKFLSKSFYFVFYCILVIIAGISSCFANIPILSLLQKSVPSDLRGRVFGLISMMTSLIEPLGMLLAGLLIDKIPVYILPIFSSVFLVLLTHSIYSGIKS
ncbi:MAG: MFS transporter [Thermovenabulum sp.]|uniref:MFS transporter n=1 Tax=Thermovenabulum sp. TaxID=3100335 RepID=UPI003C79F151